MTEPLPGRAIRSPVRKPILVIGSINVDIITRVADFPRPGETVSGSDIVKAAGGKGANQAVAAARSGAAVHFLGAVGSDGLGAEMTGILEAEGIVTRMVAVEPRAATGAAVITIDSRGENTIVVSPGANARVTARRVQAARSAIRNASLVILQREIPPQAVEAAIEVAASESVPVVFNTAPAGRLPKRILRRVSVLIANETEAEALLARKVRGPAAARAAVKDLAAATGGRTAIVTVGAAGAWLCHPTAPNAVHIAPHRVKVVDTTAAGDTFVGAFAARYLEHGDPIEAARFASAAAALGVTRLGAIPSIPHGREVERMLNTPAE